MFLAIVDKAYEVVRLQLEDVSDEVDPLTHDVMRIVNIPFRMVDYLYFIFTGTDAEIKPDNDDEEEVKEEVKVGKKEETPEHRFKELYEEAMGRIDMLKKNQKELQGMLTRIQDSFLPAQTAAVPEGGVAGGE